MSEQTPLTGVCPHGTHYSDEFIEVMWIRCVAQGHNMLILLRIEPALEYH